MNWIESAFNLSRKNIARYFLDREKIQRGDMRRLFPMKYVSNQFEFTKEFDELFTHL
jgi:hypothetical protein